MRPPCSFHWLTSRSSRGGQRPRRGATPARDCGALCPSAHPTTVLDAGQFTISPSSSNTRCHVSIRDPRGEDLRAVRRDGAIFAGRRPIPHPGLAPPGVTRSAFELLDWTRAGQSLAQTPNTHSEDGGWLQSDSRAAEALEQFRWRACCFGRDYLLARGSLLWMGDASLQLENLTAARISTMRRSRRARTLRSVARGRGALALGISYQPWFVPSSAWHFEQARTLFEAYRKRRGRPSLTSIQIVSIDLVMSQKSVDCGGRLGEVCVGRFRGQAARTRTPRQQRTTSGRLPGRWRRPSVDSPQPIWWALRSNSWLATTRGSYKALGDYQGGGLLQPVARAGSEAGVCVPGAQV